MQILSRLHGPVEEIVSIKLYRWPLADLLRGEKIYKIEVQTKESAPEKRLPSYYRLKSPVLFC